MTVSEIIFKKNLNIGSISAECDSEFLENCFVETSEYKDIIDFNNQKIILLGRTGVGKTALLNQLKSYSKVIYIEIKPDTFALQYITNVPFVSKLKEEGVNLDIFYKFLWLHEIISQVIKKYFAYNRKNFLFELKERASDKGRINELNKYIKEYEGIFFNETANEKITSELEKAVSTLIGDRPLGVDIKLSESVKKEIQAHTSQYINKKQISQLKNIITLLREYFEQNKQQKIIVAIDNLDEDWIDTDSKYCLINALLNAVKMFIDFSNLKILLAMRADLLAKACEVVNRQNEKDDAYILRINWTRDALLHLLDKRVQYLFKFKYNKNSQISAKDIFDFQINNIPACDYIVDRTMMRPRDLIEFVNLCIEEADGSTKITPANVLNAEKHFKRKRFQALSHEWLSVYGNIEPYSELINLLGGTFKYVDLLSDDKYKEIEEIVYKKYWQNPMFKDFLEINNPTEKSSKEKNIRNILNAAYVMGLIGIKDSNGVSYATPNSPTLESWDYHSELQFVVHPLFAPHY